MNRPLRSLHAVAGAAAPLLIPLAIPSGDPVVPAGPPNARPRALIRR